jgi:hypothetical protein
LCAGDTGQKNDRESNQGEVAHTIAVLATDSMRNRPARVAG